MRAIYSLGSPGLKIAWESSSARFGPVVDEIRSPFLLVIVNPALFFDILRHIITEPVLTFEKLTA
jgi:hypothetical protein